MKIVVGEGSCGIAAGAEKVRQALLKEDLNGAMLTIAGCIGMCYLEPIVDIYEDGKEVKRLVRVTENDAKKIAEYAKTGDENAIAPLLVSDEDKEFLNKQTRIALRRCGIINPDEIEDFIQADGYTAIKKVLNEMTPEDQKSALITRGLGGKKNISDVDCCATRLRCTVSNPDLVNDGILKATGASGVVHRGQGVQVIYGPSVTVIKADLEDYLEHAPKELYEPQKDTESTGQNVSEDATIEDKAGEKKVVDTIVISSPITGLAADLSTTPDEAFAGRMMGDGAVVTPEDAIVRAPEDGEVCFVFDTKHAIGFMTESGVSLLIHVGIDTVKLDGKGFECFVENGQAVKKGDPMLKLDLDYLRENAPSVASPVLCTELEDNQKIRLLNEAEIKAGDELFAIDIYEA